jgi:hypothetical protein
MLAQIGGLRLHRTMGSATVTARCRRWVHHALVSVATLMTLVPPAGRAGASLGPVVFADGF